MQTIKLQNWFQQHTVENMITHNWLENSQFAHSAPSPPFSLSSSGWSEDCTRGHYGSLNSLLGQQHSRQRVTSLTQTIIQHPCDSILPDNNTVCIGGSLLQIQPQ